VAGIGTAGENLVKIAGIMCGPSNYVRAAARGGMGALLGSKNLKAIAVRGKARPEYPDPKRFRDEVKGQNEFIKEHSLPMTNLGTAGGVMGTEKFGDIPIRNWTLGNWPEAINIAGQTFYPKYLVKHTHCYACPIGCGKEIEVKEGPYVVPAGEGVEYETLAGFGGLCHVSSFEAVALANSLCNRYGLDTISTAGVIAFGMEAFERGLIGPAETGGLALRFGDADAMLAAIGKIARREDIGATLAEGVRAAAAAIGQGSEAFAIHVKGLEIAYHDPRAFTSMAVNYATAARGGCHLEAATYWNGYGVAHPDLGYPKPLPLHASDAVTVKLCYDYQNYAGVYNPLGLCKFLIKGQVGPDRLCAVVNAALGWDWTMQDVLDAGDRIFQLKRLINLRLGLRAADDRLPARFTTEPRPTGGAAGVLPDMAVMLPIYYEMRGWDANGAPTAERLTRLGIM
jgi:aldehyde:ferredoxin oxidoreductase